MSDFELRTLVRDVLDTSTAADPTNLAREVLDRIDPADYGTALEQCMRSYVRQMVVTSRPRLSETGEDAPPATPTITPAPKVGVPFHQRGRYAQGWRDRLMASRERDPETGEYLFFGDATIPQLLRMASFRDELADANKHKAQQLRDLATVMRQHGVLRVRDLPDDALIHLTRKAA
jgi:hypothetical protein